MQAVIHFIDPEDGQPREVPIVPAMRALVAGVSLEKHKLARALQRQNAERLAGDEGLKRAYRILDAAMSEKRAANGLRNRAKAARYWETITQPPEPEDPPAFDLARSSRSLIEEALEGDLPEPEAGDQSAAADAGGGEAGSGQTDGARLPVPVEAPREEPRPVRRPRGRRAGGGAGAPAPVANPAAAEAEDLDELLRGLALRVTNNRKEGE